MLSFTLDTNCIIDIAVNRPSARAVRALSDACAAGRADVALVAASASERQEGDSYLETYAAFEERVIEVGLGHLPVLLTIAYFDLGFYGVGLLADERMVEREALIHSALFPNIALHWKDFAKANGADNLASPCLASPGAKRWRNAFCDRQMFWAHDHHRRDVFVTRDANFGRRLSRSTVFSTARILTPDEACLLLL